jgi:hypothetical protein
LGFVYASIYLKGTFASASARVKKKHALVDVRLGREVYRVTTIVDLVWILINADVVYAHGGRELDMVEVDGAEAGG